MQVYIEFLSQQQDSLIWTWQGEYNSEAYQAIKAMNLPALNIGNDAFALYITNDKQLVQTYKLVKKLPVKTYFKKKLFKLLEKEQILP